jgi:hypothetical protein
MSVKTEHYNWIDFVKAFAMLAVIIDHSFGLIYKNHFIQGYVYYSVTVFIIISGITSAISLSRRDKVDFRYILGRLSPILTLYVFASIICNFMAYQRINISVLLHQLVTFSASGPYYFVLFYIQLVAISPFLYNIFKNGKTATRLITIIVIYFISRFLNDYTFIEGIYGGGGVLLGGMYLFVYAVGMFISFYLKKLTNIVCLLIILLVSSISLFFYVKYEYVSLSFSNPPNWYLMIYSFILVGLLFSIWNLFLERIGFLKILFKPFNLIGKYSLYVFMFHLIFMGIASNFIRQIFNLNNIWALRVLIISFAVFPPIIIGYILNPYIEKKKRIQFDLMILKVNSFVDTLNKKWKVFLSSHREFKFFLVILAIAFFVRGILVLQGGQLFWPDESRFLTGYATASAFLKGDFKNFLSVYVNFPAHSGFYAVSGILGLIQEKISILTHMNFLEMNWISTLLLSMFSVGNILLIYLISLKAGAAPGEAFIAGGCMAISNSMFYYSRHLLPYDSSMFFALLALLIGLGEYRYRKYIVSGLLIGVSIWIYNGYWVLCLAVVGILTIYSVRNFRDWFLRGLIIGLGSLLPIYELGVFSFLNGSLSSISNLFSFLKTATQGSFTEGWRLPWEYLWYSEHLLLILWLAGFFSAVIIVSKTFSKVSKYIIYWISAVFAIYTIFVLGSTLLGKFVIYGRFARELIPFFCMIVAFSLYKLKYIFLQHRYVTMACLIILLVQTAYNFYTPLTQKWPKDLYLTVTQNFGDVYRDLTILGPSVANNIELDRRKSSLVLLNVDFPYPVIGIKQEYSGKIIIKESHPLNYFPYQYEGWNSNERSILRKDGFFMELIEINAIH